jgi:hypothetical protein
VRHGLRLLARAIRIRHRACPGRRCSWVGGDLRLMDMAASGAPQGPVLESGTSRRNALNLHARLAFETPAPL